MKAILICPADRPAAAFLARTRPLALVPVLGRSLLDLWLAELATRNVKTVTVLAADRPEEVRKAVGHGEAWGLKVEVLPEPRESTTESAAARFGPADHVVVLENVPPAGPPIWADTADWFRQLTASIPTSAAHRVGYRELSPGVWIHVRARISSDAKLEGPCWIGEHAWIGSRVHIGAGSVVEDDAYVDDGADVHGSWIGPGTYVGELTEVRESLAWGAGLFKWSIGAFTEVADAFLLGDTGTRARRPTSGRLVGRIVALAVFLATLPVLLLGLVRRESGQPLLRRRKVVQAPTSIENPMTCPARELAGFSGIWRRWPELWNIVRGEFTWVGNRPLTPEQAGHLTNEFERLWLAVPAGIFSLADAEGCPDAFGDEARAHASFYAVQHSWKVDFQILRRVISRVLSRDASPREKTTPASV